VCFARVTFVKKTGARE